MAPVRTCIGCRRTGPTDQLVRVARDARGQVVVGPGPGRGAWLCRDAPGCLDRAIGRKAFDRAFRAPVSGAELEQLRITLHGGHDGRPVVGSEGSVL